MKLKTPWRKKLIELHKSPLFLHGLTPEHPDSICCMIVSYVDLCETPLFLCNHRSQFPCCRISCMIMSHITYADCALYLDIMFCSSFHFFVTVCLSLSVYCVPYQENKKRVDWYCIILISYTVWGCIVLWWKKKKIWQGHRCGSVKVMQLSKKQGFRRWSRHLVSKNMEEPSHHVSTSMPTEPPFPFTPPGLRYTNSSLTGSTSSSSLEEVRQPPTPTTVESAIAWTTQKGCAPSPTLWAGMDLVRTTMQRTEMEEMVALAGPTMALEGTLTGASSACNRKQTLCRS